MNSERCQKFLRYFSLPFKAYPGKVKSTEDFFTFYPLIFSEFQVVMFPKFRI